MKRFMLFVAACIGVASLMSAAPALADSSICHNGVLSDDAGQGCADGLYNQVYGNGGGGSASSDGAICHNGILSDDAGQNCADGMYTRIYGSGGGSASQSNYTSAPQTSSSYSGDSSNSMVNPYCESGGNSQVVDASGTYWGKYQFDYQTWVAHGGAPSAYGNASEATQDQVASRVTYDAWPNC
jgi:hypothetical protein